MNFGMIGAIGGAGAGLQEQGKFLEREEEAAAADTRNRSLQDWLMRKREEYAIAGEQRAETRTIAGEQRGEDRTIRTEQRTDERGEKQKDRDYDRLGREAEGRRGVKVADKKAEKQAEYDVDGANTDTIKKTARAKAEGGETDADRAV
jgi:hypothetical protein